ncbi:predicted protein [Naegleria gruberi]|uniref:Predicted protein n=1 Tax=Naegleria gruberi TaxID=5762 RepID=D2W652_NAEGR|nr:uncharacterized protein NAEGRDRAFT_60092 [Naegleria gruberi]EFC35450.1 predicted protein [Naegleria gruberi]|eukprot:XP_002668194.1 predicted protein [Naegleria gruberi strain NEG-M]
MVLESVLSEDNKVYSDAKSYCQLLLTCAIACEISYMPDPLYTLNKEYSQFEHGIKKLCSSITNDMDAKATLETRYVVADCSDENRKRIVVAIRGSYSKSDILTDVKLIPAMNYYGYGVLHSGFLERAKFIPLDYFLEKINEGYQVVITGHSMGGAVGAILATRLMQATEAKAIKKPPIQFIGFGVPLLADVKFKERILKDEQSNYFHFYINEKDCVPRSISIVSEIISLSAESDLIDQVSNFLKTVVSAISSITGRVHRAEIINSGISVFQWFSKVIAKVIHKYAPQFSPFGNHIHISYSNNKQIVTEHQEEIYDLSDKLAEMFSREKLEMIQHHKMTNYFHEVLKICDCFEFKKDCFLKGYFNKKAEKMQDLHVPENWSFVPLRWVKKQDENADAFEGKECYSVRLIVNEATVDVNLTLISKKFVNYITKVEIINPICQQVSVRDEMNGVTYCLSGIVKDFWKHNTLHVKYLQVKFTTHFNSVIWDLPVSHVTPEVGQSVKEEKISKLPVDLLYMYALSFIFATSKVEDESIRAKRSNLLRLLGDLDELNEGSTIPKSNIDSQELNMKLLRMFFEGTNEQVGDYGKLFHLNFSFSTETAKLSEESLTFRDLVDKKFLTVLHHNSVQCSLIKEMFSEKIGMGASAAGLGISAGVCSGLLFVPGINLFAIGALIATGVVSLASFAAFMANYVRKNRDVLDYEQNLKTFMDSFYIVYSHSIPTLYHFEKLIFDWTRTNLLKYDDNAYILDHWSEVFGKGSTIGWVSVSERKKVLRVLKSACINYQIRQELMKNFYVGVVGMKKCGKSTFVEKFLHRNANASSIIATTEIQAYPLTSNSSNFAVWDFPHYESQDHLHKVQFITSRFLLDYIVVVYDALSKCDKEECKEHINVIKQSNDHRFIVLMNKADALYKPNMNMTKDHFDDTRRECSLKLGVDISRVILTSVDPAINNIHQLKPWGVNMMSEIRDVIWEDLKTTAKRTVAEVEQEWNSLKKYDALKVSIEFRRKGKNSSFCFSWDKLKNLQFRELVEELKNEFDYDNIKITTKNSLEEISDMQQLLEHEDHEFIVEKQ